MSIDNTMQHCKVKFSGGELGYHAWTAHIGMVVGSIHVCACISSVCLGTCSYGWFMLTQGADADG